MPSISTGSAVAGSVELRYMLYCYLVSSCFVEGADLISSYRLGDVKNAFTAFGEDAVVDAVMLLADEKLVLLLPQGVLVGKVVQRKKVLFSQKDESTKTYQVRLLGKLEDYVEGAVRVAYARRAQNDALALFAKALVEWTIVDFCRLYEVSYEAVFEEQLRDLTHKERGQIGYLLKHYEKATIQKMIIHFVLDCERYTKAAPSLGLLLYHKDTLKLAVESRSKSEISRKSMRRSSTKDEDF